MVSKTWKLIPIVTLSLAAGVTLTFHSCSKDVSGATGEEYNNPKNGGDLNVPYTEQETGPGLVLIEGGTFTMGRTEQEIQYEWDNMPRRVTVSSFYMDQTEITNQFYRDYLYWLKRVYDVDYPDVALKSTPDTLVWRDRLAFNEPYVETYLRHPAYKNYPVVGVNWLQANDYCAWRTDRVNEVILIREGILKVNPNQTADDNFNTDVYLAGQYEGLVKGNIEDLDPSKGQGATRKVKMEDGILLPRYRLPTEAEWEFAAIGLIGNSNDELITERRQYPWNGHIVRNADDRFKGEMMANFKRGRGDQMGVAGKLNDNADITAEVNAYWPNDYGLYNMAGNVSEWVMDVYRPLTPEDVTDFRAFRGNVYKTVVRDEEGAIAERDSLGKIKFRDVTEAESVDRRNYQKADNINYKDGDRISSSSYADQDVEEEKIMYEFGAQSMINNKSRVYKGGSWKDRAYYMSPGSRRFLDERLSTDYIGFRCAMARVGSPVGLGKK
ncbi:MAG: SUMF1/EgtB/PvdO family nonheme iron enzyme [Bacteroidia bacterium]|nr:SUMF1/EgtB/PvdO family nonheme iron enzyme [Bacteroidia bacterium]